MFWIWIVLSVILFWLFRRHPSNSNFKTFDNYSYYISKYLDINTKNNKKDKGQDN